MLWIIGIIAILFLCYVVWINTEGGIFAKVFNTFLPLFVGTAVLYVILVTVFTSLGNSKTVCVSNQSIKKFISVQAHYINFIDSAGYMQQRYETDLLFKNADNIKSIEEYQTIHWFEGSVAKFFFGSFESYGDRTYIIK